MASELSSFREEKKQLFEIKPEQLEDAKIPELPELIEAWDTSQQS